MNVQPALLIEASHTRESVRRPRLSRRTGRPAQISAEDVCRLLHEDPELAEAISEPRREQALADCTSRTARIAVGRVELAASRWTPGGIGLLVLQGLAACRVSLQKRSALELLGEGDLLNIADGDEGWPVLPVASSISVLAPLRLAVLDREFAARQLPRYPELAAALVERAVRRSSNLTMQLAIVNQPLVEDRLLMIMWHLAGRWGRVGREGVLLELRLTHALLAELVAARRPTVSCALSSLTRRGLVRRVERGWWLARPAGNDALAPGVLHTGNGIESPYPCGDRRRSPAVPRRASAPDQGAPGA